MSNFKFWGFDFDSPDSYAPRPPCIPDSSWRRERLSLPWPKDVFVPEGTYHEYFDFAHPCYRPLPHCTCRMHIWRPALPSGQPSPAPPAGTVIWLHGINEFAGRYINIIRLIVRSGFAVIAPDQAGCGYSDGPPCLFITVREWAAVAAVGHVYASRRWPDVPRFVCGHSLGALAATLLGMCCPEARTGGVVLCAAAMSLSESYFSGALRTGIACTPRALRQHIFCPSVTRRTLRVPLPPELVSTDRSNKLMQRVTSVQSMYGFVRFSDALCELFQNTVRKRISQTVQKVAQEITLTDHDLNLRGCCKCCGCCGCCGCCRCCSCKRCVSGRSVKSLERKFAKKLRRILAKLANASSEYEFYRNEIKQVAHNRVAELLKSNHSTATTTELIAIGPNEHEPVIELEVADPNNSENPIDLESSCGGVLTPTPHMAPTAPLVEFAPPPSPVPALEHSGSDSSAHDLPPAPRDPVPWAGRRMSLSEPAHSFVTAKSVVKRQVAAQREALDALNAARARYCPPPDGILGDRIFIIHGTMDYVCNSTSCQEHLLDVAGGVDWKGDPQLAQAERVLHRHEHHGGADVSDGNELSTATMEQGPYTVYAQALENAYARTLANRPFWHVKGGKHELYRDEHRWREIGDGVAAWITHKAAVVSAFGPGVANSVNVSDRIENSEEVPDLVPGVTPLQQLLAPHLRRVLSISAPVFTPQASVPETPAQLTSEESEGNEAEELALSKLVVNVSFDLPTTSTAQPTATAGCLQEHNHSAGFEPQSVQLVITE